MNATSNVKIPGVHRRRFGLLPARVGMSHNLACRDGVTRLLSVKDRSRLKDDIGLIVKCLTCGIEALSVEELAQEHPTYAAMVKSEMVHIWAYVSEEGLQDFEPSNPEDFHKTQAEIARANAAYEKSPAGLFGDAVPE